MRTVVARRSVASIEPKTSTASTLTPAPPVTHDSSPSSSRSPVISRSSPTAGSIRSIVVASSGTTATATEPSGQRRPASSAPSSSCETTPCAPGTSAKASTSSAIAASSSAVSPSTFRYTTSAGAVRPDSNLSPSSPTTRVDSASEGRKTTGSLTVASCRRGWSGPSATAARSHAAITSHFARGPASRAHHGRDVLSIVCLAYKERSKTAAWPCPTPTQSVASP